MAAGSIVIDLLMKTGAFETDTKRAERALSNFTKEVGKVSAAAGAMSVAAAGAAVAWVVHMGKVGTEVDRLSKLSNMTAESFQRQAFAAKTVGIEQEKLSDIFKDVQDRVGDFLTTGAGPMKDFFEQIAPRINVTAEQFRKLSGAESLGLFYKSLERAGLSQSQIIFYMEAMASDSALLSPLLANNGREMKRLGDEAERLGIVLKNDTITASKELNENVTRLTSVFDSFNTRLGNATIPFITEFIDLLTQSAEKSDTLNGAVEDLADDKLKTWAQDGIKFVAALADVAVKAGQAFVYTANAIAYAALWAGHLSNLADKYTGGNQLMGILNPGQSTSTDSRADMSSKFIDEQGKILQESRDRLLDTSNLLVGLADRAADKTDVAFVKTLTELSSLSQFGSVVTKATESVSKLPTTIDGLRLKSSESVAGGSANAGTIAAAHAIQQMFGQSLEHFASLNDAWHKNNRPNSKHVSGLALDASVTGGSAADANKIKTYFSALGFESGKEFSVQFEKAGVKGATGDHIHFQWNSAEAANRFAQNNSLSGLNEFIDLQKKGAAEAKKNAVVQLADIKRANSEQGNYFRNQLSLLDNVDQKTQEYYQSKISLTQQAAQADVDAINKHISLLQQVGGKENLEKIKDLEADRRNILRDSEASVARINFEYKNGWEQTKRAIDDARASADAYLKVMNDNNERELTGLGQGDSRRELFGRQNGITDKYSQSLIDLNQDRWKITPEEYGGRLETIQYIFDGEMALAKSHYESMKTAQTSWLLGAQEGLTNFADVSSNAYSHVSEAVTSVFGGMTEQLTTFVTKGKGDFKGLVDSFISDLVRLTIQQNVTGPAAGLIGKVIGGVFGGGTQNGFDSSAAITVGGGGYGFGGLKLAGGGEVVGPGTSTSDSVPAMLSVGETVVNAKASSAPGIPQFLAALNKGFRPLRLASGGRVGSSAPPATLFEGRGNVNVNIHNAPAGAEVTKSQDGMGNTNIDVIFDQFEGRLADRALNKQGPLYKAQRSTFRLPAKAAV